MGNRISKVYTKTGDDGSSALASGNRYHKDASVFDLMGTLDELNAHIGLAQAWLQEMTSNLGGDDDTVATLDNELQIIQHLLFNAGGMLAMGDDPKMQEQLPTAYLLSEEHVQWLETHLDAHNALLPPLKDFILPAGKPLNCQLHMARAVCRRAERLAVGVYHDSRDDNKVDTHQACPATDKPTSRLPKLEPAMTSLIMRWLNRLSDYLFVVSRVSCHLSHSHLSHKSDQSTDQDSREVLWDRQVLERVPTSE